MKINSKLITAILSGTIALSTTGCTIRIDVPDDFGQKFDVTVDGDNVNIKYIDDTTSTTVVSTPTTTEVKPSTTKVTDTTSTVKATNTTTKATTSTVKTTTKATTTTTSTTSTTTTTSTTKATTVPTTIATSGATFPSESISPDHFTRTYTCNKWVEYGEFEYVVQYGDTIFNLAPKFNIDREILLALNDLEIVDGKLNKTLIAGQTVLKVPAKLVKYYVNETTRFDEVARIVGQHPDELRKTTRTPGHEYLNTEYIKGGTEIVVKALFHDELTYDNLYGTETIITPNVILQDVAKFEVATGWTGATNNVLVLYENYIGNVKSNRVTWIELIDGPKYNETNVAENVLDIGKIENIPVAYIDEEFSVNRDLGTARYPGTNIWYGYHPYYYGDDIVVTYNNKFQYELGLGETPKVKTY